jgi:putative serine protease PepD
MNPVSAAAQNVTPSVVTIAVTSGGTRPGIILDTQGDVLTNAHVATLDGRASKPAIEVRTSGGNVYNGTVLGADQLSDLAVIKIKAPNPTPASLGESSKVNVGDTPSLSAHRWD